MVRTIRARFSQGVFEPLEPEVATALHEGEEVLLTVSTPASGDPADPIERDGWRLEESRRR